MDFDQMMNDIQQGLVLLGHDQAVGVEIFETPNGGTWVANVPAHDRLDEPLDYGAEAKTPTEALMAMRTVVIDAVRERVKKAEEPATWLRALRDRPPVKVPR